MKYFAYGSNMSTARLIARVPSAIALGAYQLSQHKLRFHKSGSDGSGKCDACFTGRHDDIVHGALYEIDPGEQVFLDNVEGLGLGYDRKNVIVLNDQGESFEAFTYYATAIDEDLKPYSWYKNHVLIGALETALPKYYVDTEILSIESVEDQNLERDTKERFIHELAQEIQRNAD